LCPPGRHQGLLEGQERILGRVERMERELGAMIRISYADGTFVLSYLRTPLQLIPDLLASRIKSAIRNPKFEIEDPSSFLAF
jgi:hypothetical protein